MIFNGSRVSIRPGALKSSDEYDSARADVLHFDDDKGKFALELIHPSFNRKRILCRGDALDFHYALLRSNLLSAQEELRRKSVAFQECDGFAPSAGGGSKGGGFGKALVATSGFATDDVVLVDRPFLVVSNPPGLERWVRRWDCFFEVTKLSHAGSRETLQAFEAMDHGGEDVVASLLPDARETLNIMWSLSSAQAQFPPAVVEQETRKVAVVFARWQTNQHAFPACGDQERRALYWLAPKVAHSCDPNVGWEDPDASGAVELRAMREIAAGEVLGVNYMDDDFLFRPVEERKRRLKAERKFDCLCTRCRREMALSGVDPGSRATAGGLPARPAPGPGRPPIEVLDGESARPWLDAMD